MNSGSSVPPFLPPTERRRPHLPMSCPCAMPCGPTMSCSKRSSASIRPVFHRPTSNWLPAGAIAWPVPFTSCAISKNTPSFSPSAHPPAPMACWDWPARLRRSQEVSLPSACKPCYCRLKTTLSTTASWNPMPSSLARASVPR